MFKRPVTWFQKRRKDITGGTEPFKLGILDGKKPMPERMKPSPFVYPNTYATEKTTGPDRLIIAPASNQIELVLELARTLPEPFGIVYVLLAPVGKSGEPGRYQSPAPASRNTMELLLTHFRDYFESDGRHHLWVTSLQNSATLVYDNHNVIYAYGPLEAFRSVLRKRGLSEKEGRIPVPHSHHYNPQFNDSEREIMAYWAWTRSPLAENDDG